MLRWANLFLHDHLQEISLDILWSSVNITVCSVKIFILKDIKFYLFPQLLSPDNDFKITLYNYDKSQRGRGNSLYKFVFCLYRRQFITVCLVTCLSGSLYLHLYITTVSASLLYISQRLSLAMSLYFTVPLSLCHFISSSLYIWYCLCLNVS